MAGKNSSKISKGMKKYHRTAKRRSSHAGTRKAARTRWASKSKKG